MKQKHWKVSVFDKTSETIRGDTFYTTDTEAYLIFELIDEDFTPDSATVTVYNIYGKATLNASVEVADGTVRYEVPEEAIGHPGGWRTQVIYTKDNEDYTTKIIEFDVGGHLLDNKKPAIVDIENWNSFIAHAEELIDDWEQLEEIRQTNEQQRQDNYQELLDTGVLQTNINTKLEALEEEYAPKLTETTAQLAQTEHKLKSESLKSSQIQAQTRNVSDLKTMVTFIDDDGYDGVLDILKPMFTSRGVPYVIALRGDAVILRTEEKREQVRDLQDNHGWEMASHTMTHINLKNATDEEIEEDSINFLNLMHDYGLDVESMVYPWGERGNTSVISKYYRAGFLTDNGVNNDITLDDYGIGREMLGNHPSRDTSFFKDMIDSIDGEPRWLVFMTHVSDPATNVQQIEDVVDYVISKNIPIVTAREGLKHYGSVISTQENKALGQNHFRVKANGFIQTNKYMLNYRTIGNNGNVITSDSLPSDFDIGVTTNVFTLQDVPPLPFSGVLVTTKASNTLGHASQLLYGMVGDPGSEPKISYRTSSTRSDEWGNWLSLNGIVAYGSVTEDSPVTDFQYGESVSFVTGWSVGNGTVKTIRATGNANYGRQLFFPSTNDNIYTRRESSDGWRAWKQIQMVD